jgi:hypothetical protein
VMTLRLWMLLLFTLLYSILTDTVTLGFMGLKGPPVRLRVKKDVVQNFITFANISNVQMPQSIVGEENGCWLLQEYMQLPAAQYACVPMPLNSSLQRVYGSEDEFILEVPEVSFKLPRGNVDIRPQVRARVQVEPDRVVIQSISCTISGSPLIEKLKLNERYELDVKVILTWGQNERAQDDIDIDDDDDDDIEEMNNDTEEDVAVQEPTILQDSVRAFAEVDVDVYPPSRFKVIPRRLLAKAGNAGVSYILGLLLDNFLKGLAEDYERWAMDLDYREERMLLQDQLKLELQALS